MASAWPTTPILTPRRARAQARPRPPAQARRVRGDRSPVSHADARTCSRSPARRSPAAPPAPAQQLARQHRRARARRGRQDARAAVRGHQTWPDGSAGRQHRPGDTRAIDVSGLSSHTPRSSHPVTDRPDRSDQDENAQCWGSTRRADRGTARVLSDVFITQRDASCRRNPAHGWLTHPGGRLRVPVHSCEPSGEPSSSDIRPHGAYWSVRFMRFTRHPDKTTHFGRR